MHAGVRCETITLPSKPGSGGKKGTSWEREFGKELSKWWSGGKDPNVFTNRSGSGGRKRDKQGDSGHSGDIYADKIEGLPFTERYSMELKFYGDLSPCLWALFSRESTKQLDEFWEQAVTAAEPYNRFVLLVLRANGRKPLIVTDDIRLTELLNGFFRMVMQTTVGVIPLEDLFGASPTDLMGGLTSNTTKTRRRFHR